MIVAHSVVLDDRRAPPRRFVPQRTLAGIIRSSRRHPTVKPASVDGKPKLHAARGKSPTAQSDTENVTEKRNDHLV